MEEEKPPLSLLARMKQKAIEQIPYGGEFAEQPAKVSVKSCPNCGAGRVKQDGLTHCAYCGFEFIAVNLTNGIHIKKDDNSSSNK